MKKILKLFKFIYLILIMNNILFYFNILKINMKKDNLILFQNKLK